MYNRIALGLLPLLITSMWLGAPAEAARSNDAPILPVALSYPPQTQVTTHATETNKDWDCDWAMDCSRGYPALHFGVAMSLGRVDGWSQVGEWIPDPHRHPHRGVSWVTFFNRTTGTDGSAAMFLDYFHVMEVLTFSNVLTTKSRITVPAGTGNVMEMEAVDTDQDFQEYSMAAWTGNVEIEAFAIVHPRENRSLRQVAYRYLQIQVEEATRMALHPQW